MNYQIVNARITGIDKEYYLNQLQQFTSKVNKRKFSLVEFGKQDQRGGFSICLYCKNHSIKHQKIFNSKDELLGFVVGVNTYYKGVINNLDGYKG